MQKIRISAWCILSAGGSSTSTTPAEPNLDVPAAFAADADADVAVVGAGRGEGCGEVEGSVLTLTSLPPPRDPTAHVRYKGTRRCWRDQDEKGKGSGLEFR